MVTSTLYAVISAVIVSKAKTIWSDPATSKSRRSLHIVFVFYLLGRKAKDRFASFHLCLYTHFMVLISLKFVTFNRNDRKEAQGDR